MVELPSQLLLAVRSRFTRRTRLEDEDLLLRQQLAALRRKLYGPSPPTTVPRLEDFPAFHTDAAGFTGNLGGDSHG